MQRLLTTMQWRAFMVQQRQTRPSFRLPMLLICWFLSCSQYSQQISQCLEQRLSFYCKPWPNFINLSNVCLLGYKLHEDKCCRSHPAPIPAPGTMPDSLQKPRTICWTNPQKLTQELHCELNVSPQKDFPVFPMFNDLQKQNSKGLQVQWIIFHVFAEIDKNRKLSVRKAWQWFSDFAYCFIEDEQQVTQQAD
jgi:hypothetical protein